MAVVSPSMWCRDDWRFWCFCWHREKTENICTAHAHASEQNSKIQRQHSRALDAHYMSNILITWTLNAGILESLLENSRAAARQTVQAAFFRLPTLLTCCGVWKSSSCSRVASGAGTGLSVGKAALRWLRIDVSRCGRSTWSGHHTNARRRPPE